MGAPLLEIHDLQKHFLVKKSFSAQNRVYLKAVDGVDLTMEKGETIGLVGESGCGKSTLGRTILKLHSVTGGQIVYEGKDITKYTPDQMMEYRRKMQLIFQARLHRSIQERPSCSRWRRRWTSRTTSPRRNAASGSSRCWMLSVWVKNT